MNITEFFQLRAGTWKSQRTSHQPAIERSESANSEIQVEFLESIDPQVAKFSMLHSFGAEQTLCGIAVKWKGTDKSQTQAQNQDGSTILVAIAGEDPQQGKILRQQVGSDRVPVIGRYSIGDDDVLSLITESDGLHAEEKMWFPRPNICMRAGFTVDLTTGSAAETVASFCTEIRIVKPSI